VNYRNYYSDAQRTDYMGYLKYDLNVTDRIKWSAQVYTHHNDGVGVVAGPLQFVWNSPIKYYYPTLTQAQFAATVDPSGYIVRTTEYRIQRKGIISNLNIDLGNHQVELGGWYQGNSSHAWRRWYVLDQNNLDGFSPYIRPSNPMFTQYAAEMRVDTLQLHLQDSWKVTPRLLVEYGVKTSAQYANGWFAVQPAAGSLAGASTALPSGRLDTESGSCPPSAPSGKRPATSRSISTSRRTSASIRPMAAAAAPTRGRPPARPRSITSRPMVSLKARGPMKWAFAPIAASSTRPSP
jgi:hypothetical protein